MKAGMKLKDIEAKAKEMDLDSAIIFLLEQGSELGPVAHRLLHKYLKKKEAADREFIRLNRMLKYENKAYANGYQYIAGIDEAGRGPLAGPVVAAAVILPRDACIEGLNDSKQLTEKQRAGLFEEIKEKAVAYGIGIVDEKTIDEINILQAAKKAMKEAIANLTPAPDYLLIDSVKLPDLQIKQLSMDKGDALSLSIAAASVIAKVTRDRLLEEADKLFPRYGFAKHKGYGTYEHIKAIKKYGGCPIHRVSYIKKFV
ncbi:MAG: ribonuclease HII [Clostridia bacterium]|nr:ribonuclease HII [Clostridia bacterium]